MRRDQPEKVHVETGEGARIFSELGDAHLESVVEWWFFQGSYEGKISGLRYFMATLFRSNFEDSGHRRADGFQLMLAVFNPNKDENQHASSTWIDRIAYNKVIEKHRTSEPHIDPVVQCAFVREIAEHGPPHPIILKEVPEVFEAWPLQVEWDGFALARSDTGMTLRFHEPGSERLVSLNLTTRAHGLDIACGNEQFKLGSAMTYRCHPRISVVGSVDSREDLAGQVWMDHQWGDRDWLHDPQAGIVFGWEWFGINFTDGSDLLIMQHRNARTGDIIGAHVTYRMPDGEAQVFYDLSLIPVKRWTSPTTFIDYPVAWEIRISGLESTLVFLPLRDDQEIAAFGTMRAVWEGVGNVNGTLRGCDVYGTARGEFHGYGYVFDHKKFIQSMGGRVDRHLEEFFPRRFDAAQVEKLVGPAHWEHDVDVYTEMLSVPVWDLIDRSGKRWRPVFGILLLEALGVASGPYEGLISCMLEFIHAGALIIDDIEDESLLRRGRQCIHLRYGLDVALNAGNTLYFLPGLAVMSHPLLTAEKRRRWLEIKEGICIEAHCGQATDIFWSRRMTHENLQRQLAGDMEAKILQMYALKTASAAKGAAEFVATIADASPELTKVCVDFARILGVAYQVVDDIHNFSRSPDWTKVTGEDLINGKPTLVLVKAIRQLGRVESERLQTILSSPELRHQPEVIEEGIELVYRSGALDLCRETAKSMVDEAWNAFSPWVRSSGPKIMLYTMCLKLIELAYDA